MCISARTASRSSLARLACGVTRVQLPITRTSFAAMRRGTGTSRIDALGRVFRDRVFESDCSRVDEQNEITEANPMQHTFRPELTAGRGRRRLFRRVFTLVSFIAGAAIMQSGVAAEFELAGTGTFKPPSTERFANVPADLPFSKADLASGIWSFALRYDDRTPDSDPDPYVGRYVGAIRAVRLSVGSTNVELPVNQSEIVVSNGGLGFPERESLRMQVTSKTPYGVVRVSWNQIHQTATRMDLRGAPGLLSSDALPVPSVLANLLTARAFDKFFLLRVDAPTQLQPLLYLSSSTLSVTVEAVSAP